MGVFAAEEGGHIEVCPCLQIQLFWNTVSPLCVCVFLPLRRFWALHCRLVQNTGEIVVLQTQFMNTNISLPSQEFTCWRSANVNLVKVNETDY